MSDVNEVATKLSVEQDLKTLIPIANPPAVWITRDTWCNRATDLIDVWVRKPTREVAPTLSEAERSVTYVTSDAWDPRECTFEKYMEESPLVGRFTVAQIRERFGIVPDGDDCIYIDNPKVN